VCIIDNPPRYHGISMYTSEYADKIIIPVQSEGAAFKATLRTYVEMKVSFPYWEDQDVNVLVTQHNGKRNAASSFLQGFRNWALAETMNYERFNKGKRLKLKVLSTVIPDSADVENVKLEQANLFLKKSKSELAKAYVAATEEIIPELGGINHRLQALVDSRKQENFEKNIRPNAFKKKEQPVGEA
jgi:cellulose biosynthesis protein BcsQ